MNSSLDIRHPAVLFASVLAAILTAFMLIAAISPQINVDIPGVRDCSRGTSCIRSGGGD